MLWRIIGTASLVWGAVVFYILSTTPPPSTSQVPLSPTLEFTIYILSLGWLIASSLVKVGFVLNKKWVKVSIVSCIFFIFLLINMGLMHTHLQGGQAPASPQESTSYPYFLIASWFVSWFWVDTFVLFICFMQWLVKKKMSS